MALTPHCGRYCRPEGWAPWFPQGYHYHATAKRKRFVKRHRRMQPYERPHIGAREA